MARRRRYNPKQKRDSHGQWTRGNPATVSTRTQTGQAARAQYAAAYKKKQARKTAVKRVAAGLGIAAVAGATVYGLTRPAGTFKRNKTAPPGSASVASAPVAKSTGVSKPISKAPTKPGPMVVKASAKAPSRRLAGQPSGKNFQATNAQKQAEVKVPSATKVAVATPAPSAKKNPTSNPVKTPTVHAGAVSSVKDSTPATAPKAKTPKKPNKAGVQDPVATPVKVTKPTGNYVKANQQMVRAMRQAGLQPGAGVGRMNNDGKFVKTARSEEVANRVEKDHMSAIHGQRTAKNDAKRAEMAKAIRSTPVVSSGGTRRERAETRYASILEGHKARGGTLSRSQRKFLSDLA